MHGNLVAHISTQLFRLLCSFLLSSADLTIFAELAANADMSVNISLIRVVSRVVNADVWESSACRGRPLITNSCLRMSSQPSNEIFLVNPYQSHPSLAPLEAEVLWEYAKLAQNLRMVRFTSGKDLRKKNHPRIYQRSRRKPVFSTRNPID